ncbi:DUF3794 domain-containing protein [Pseudalkalibacillus hwajinpoensis]|nr:DUF3794 domain-containing protein [Pseudalkalibacillus hwajinpoensis]
MKANLGQVNCTVTGNYVESPHSSCDDQPLIITTGECSSAKKAALLADGNDTWTQIFVPEVLCVPSQKPDIEELMSVNARVKIISQRVIRTPYYETTPGDPTTVVPIENEEGTYLTGRKLVVEGILRQKVIYTACTEDQSVHSAHFDVPFSAFIILPVGTPLTTQYKIDTCIEDIFISRTTERQIFKNVTLFIKATPLVCPPQGGGQ